MITATDIVRSAEDGWRWCQSHKRATVAGLLCLLLAVRLIGGSDSSESPNESAVAEIKEMLMVEMMRDTINKARQASHMVSLGRSRDLDDWAERVLKAGAMKNDLLVFTVDVPDDEGACATALTLMFDERFLQVNKEPSVNNVGVATALAGKGRRRFCAVFGQ